MADTTTPRNNLNTLLLSVSLGVLSFIGWSSYNNALAVAGLVASQVTRPEIETKIAEVKTEQARQAGELAKIQLDIATIQMTIRKEYKPIP